MEYPICTIVMTTWLTSKIRKSVAEKTLVTWHEYLEYEGELRLHIADDGSTLKWKPETFWDGTITYSRQERQGVGASLNAGFKVAFETSPIVLYAVDDWSLIEPFDLTPWVKLLVEREDVGMVRLGPPHPYTKGTVEIFTDDWQGWGLRLDKTGFAFGHRPALYHQRLIQHYGWFAENASALECERLYAENFCKTTGPDIVLALQHPWQHLESIELSSVEPN